MKKLTIFLILTFWSYGEFPGTKEIFTNLRAAWLKNTPPEYSCEVTSPLVTAQYKNIPKEKIAFGKTPNLKFYFKTNEGFKLMVENVDAFYEQYFSIYEDILIKSGLYLTVDTKNTYPKFISDYQLFWMKGNKLKVVEADALDGDYGIFYITDSWQISRSEYYEANKEVATVDFTYVEHKGFLILNKLDINLKKNNPSGQDFQVHFKDFDLTAVPKDIF